MSLDLEKLKELNRHTQTIDLTPIVNHIEILEKKIDNLSKQNQDRLTAKLELLSEQVWKIQDRSSKTFEENMKKIYISILKITGAASIAMIIISILLSVCLNLLKMFRM